VAAQQPEEVDPNGGVKKKIEVPPHWKDRANQPDAVLDELVRAEAAAAHQDLKALFKRFSVPFDLLTDVRDKTVTVRPIPACWRVGAPAGADFPVIDLDVAPPAARKVLVNDVKDVKHFEELAFAAVDRLVKRDPDDGLTAGDQLDAAEK